jgi:Ca-activated chloride channel family protein
VATEPGYFVFLASPQVKSEGAPEPKDIVFVLDKSGSMRTDGKMKQAKDALSYCLRSLNEGDRFGVVVFSSGVERYAEKLAPYVEPEKEKALAYVGRVEPDGGTNINDALLAAQSFFEAGPRLKMIVFLTDGLPTIGVTAVPAIVKNVTEANKAEVRVFNFGVGYDVNTTLLDKIARENKGDSEYVKPKEDLEARVSAFYSKVQSPVLAGLKLDWAGIKAFDLLPRQMPDLFKGGQIIVSGRYDGSGPRKLVLTGTAQGKAQRFEFEVAFDEKSDGTGKLFVERLWAQRKIGDIVDQIQLYGKSQELVDEIVRLSTKYGIITEYTSFLITEDMPLNDHRRNAERAGRELDRLKADTGTDGNRQVEAKKALQSAPQAPAVTAGKFGGGAGYTNEKGEKVLAKNVQNVGRRTFYQRKNVWQEADVPEDTKAVEVKYFSDEFFKLLEENPELNEIAALDADVIVKVKDQHVRLAK